MRFRKKPIEIEAFGTAELLTAAQEDWAALPECIRKAYDLGNVLFLPNGMEIRTLEGVMRAERADWIIQGVQGELYPCKPDIFFATYEAAV